MKLGVELDLILNQMFNVELNSCVNLFSQDVQDKKQSVFKLAGKVTQSYHTSSSSSFHGDSIRVLFWICLFFRTSTSP